MASREPHLGPVIAGAKEVDVAELGAGVRDGGPVAVGEGDVVGGNCSGGHPLLVEAA